MTYSKELRKLTEIIIDNTADNITSSEYEVERKMYYLKIAR